MINDILPRRTAVWVFMAFASAYYHWFHLIQPSPLPEKMIGGNVLHYLHAKLGGWGSGNTSFIEPEAMAEYERSLTLQPDRKSVV